MTGAREAAVNVALVGLGEWGPNLARNLAGLPDARLHTLCDARPERLPALQRRYPAATVRTEYGAVLADPEVDAVVVATPVATHFELAAAALEAGKHVMIEKPLARTSAECRKLIALAEAGGLTLMAGHVFIYNAAVRRVKEYIRSGELGDVHYIYSQRLNLGRVRTDVNALWNFAPHDLAILAYWLDAAPEAATASGFSYLQPGIEDVVFVTLEFPGGIGAHVHISWLDPRKVRCMTVVGSKKMVVYDDVSPDARLAVYDKGVSRTAPATSHPSLGAYSTYGEFQLLLRAGDVVIPKLEFREPLSEECAHFVHCIRSGKAPDTDGANGLAVVQALEAAERSLRHGGRQRVEGP
jgi:predicted dehydrogenase